MHDEVRVVAGECTATFDDGTEREHRGDVLAVISPMNWLSTSGFGLGSVLTD